MTSQPMRRARGFTMVEPMIALVLLALMSAVLFGSLSLSGRSAEAGTAKAEASSGMRLAGDYLRTQLAAQHSQRMRKMQDFPLLLRRRFRPVALRRAVAGPRGIGRHLVLPPQADDAGWQGRAFFETPNA